MTSKLDISYLDPLALQPDVTLLARYASSGTSVTIDMDDSIRNQKGSKTNFALYFQVAYQGGSLPSDSTPSGWTKILTNTSSNSMRTSVFYKTGTITSDVTGGLSTGGFGRVIGVLFLFNIKGLTPTVTISDSDSSGTQPTPAAQDYTYTGSNPSLGFAFKTAFNSETADITTNITPKYSFESFLSVLTNAVVIRVLLYPYDANSNPPTINVSSTTDNGDFEILGGGYVSFS